MLSYELEDPMPAITVEDSSVLPRIRRPDPAHTIDRPVRRVVQSHRQVEGAGFEVWRPFPGAISSLTRTRSHCSTSWGRPPDHKHASAATHELVEFAPGDNIVLRAANRMSGRWDALDVLLLGGLPSREPIARYGSFVMNSRDEITQAITDYQARQPGIIPAV
jgi:hypothetical protein